MLEIDDGAKGFNGICNRGKLHSERTVPTPSVRGQTRARLPSAAKGTLMPKKKSSTQRRRPAPEAKTSAKRRKPAKPKKSPLTPEKFRKLAAPYLQLMASMPVTKQEKAEKLRAYHSLGRILQAQMPPRSYGDKQMEQMAKAIGRKRRWLYLVWQFAKTYTQEDLENLCEYANHLTWAHVLCLLSLDKEKRSRYQQRAAERNWKTQDLRRAIRREAQSSGDPADRKGPRIHVPDDPVDALDRLVDEGERWCRRCDLVAAKIDGIRSQRARRQVQKVAEDAKSVLRDVARAARDAMKKLPQDEGR